MQWQAVLCCQRHLSEAVMHAYMFCATLAHVYRWQSRENLF